MYELWFRVRNVAFAAVRKKLKHYSIFFPAIEVSVVAVSAVAPVDHNHFVFQYIESAGNILNKDKTRIFEKRF